MRLPPLKDLAALVKSIKSDIEPEFRAFDEDDIPGIQLTVGASPNGDWDYQTGDNSYSGGAYFHPAWGVVGVYRRSNARDVARDLQNQIAEALEYCED